MITIYLKELRSYFKSFFGWLFLAAFTSVFGFFFSALSIYYGDPHISVPIIRMIILVMFLIPLITMRVMSEEKKLKTDQMLLTYPVNGFKVILGKYLSIVTIMFLTCLIVLVGVGVVRIYGPIPWGDTFSAISALFLFECLLCSIGFMFSSITEHQFVSAILTYASYLFIYLVPSISSIFFTASELTQSTKVLNKIGKTIDLFSFLNPVNSMLNGMFKITDVVYIISIIAVNLLIAYIVFAKNSIQLTAVGRNKFFATGLGYLVIILAIVGINIGVRYIPEEYSQIDLTENKMYSLTYDSKKMLKELDDDITIHCIGEAEVVDDYIVKYLKLYDKSSKHLTVEYHSKKDEPSFYKTYSDDSLLVGSLIVTKGEEFKIINYNDLFETGYDYDQYYQPQEYVSAIDMEGQITGAIASFYEDSTYKTVYNTTGHNEFSVSDNMLKRFRKGNYNVRDINLLTESVIPADCKLLIVNGPTTDLAVNEAAKIDAYINAGGNAVFILPNDGVECPNYIGLLNDLGLDVTSGTVLEPKLDKSYNGTPYWILEDPLATEYTDCVNNRKLFLPESRGIIVSEEMPAGIGAEVLIESTTNSYSKVLRSDTYINREDGDEEGPYALAVVLEKYDADCDETSYIAVFGSDMFTEEQTNEIVSGANNDLLFSIINKMFDTSIVSTIPAKPLDSYDYITITTSMKLLYAGLSIIVVPLILIVSGIVIIIRRRKK